jgi:hypothetical protein
MKITYLVKYGRFMFCLHMNTERTEAQCPCCHVAYGSNEHAACRTLCVVNLYARVLGVLVVNRPIRFSVDRCRITKKVCV